MESLLNQNNSLVRPIADDFSSKENSELLHNILDLSKKLIAIHSTRDNPDGFTEVLTLIKKQLKEFTIESFVHNHIPSLLIHNQKTGTKKFKILLNAHVDVVPATEEQFNPFVANGKLFGRGVYDMKAATAVFIYLFKKLAKKLPYTIALQITTDEEHGGFDGAKYQIDKGIRTDFAITGECGSNFRIVNQAKGMLRLKLSAKGKASHSAYPWLGENAILKLNTAIYKILQIYPLPTEDAYHTTINVTNISDNKTEIHTVTPDYCEAILDVRFIPSDEKTLLKRIASVLPKDIQYETLFTSPALNTDEKNSHVQHLLTATEQIMQRKASLGKAHATSDGRHFSEAGCSAVEFGPIGGEQHQKNEWVDINSLKDYFFVLEKFLNEVKK